VFGKSVGTLGPGDVLLDVDLEPQLTAIGQTMQTFLSGAGKKLASKDLQLDAVEAFLCWEAQLG
jgi:hypothetical protein